MHNAFLTLAALLLADCVPGSTRRPSVDPRHETVPDKPAVASVREVRDVYFGKEVVDPYRWMESDSPEYQKWMRAQSDYTRKTLDGLDIRTALLDRIKELDNAGNQVWRVGVRHRRVFSMEVASGSEIAKLFVRDGISGEKRLLIDPDTFKTNEAFFSIDYWSVSPDARYLAFGLSQAGSEMAVLRIVETATGRILPDVIDRARYASPSWRDDGSFFYKRDRKLQADAPATERFTKARVYLHHIGANPDNDEAVFGYGVSAGVNVPEEGIPVVVANTTSPYLLAVLSHGVQKERSIWFAHRKSYAGAKTPWKKLVDPRDEISDYDIRGDDIYLVSHRGSPRAKLLRLNLKSPDMSKAQTVMSESEAVLRSTGLGKDALYVLKLDAGIGQLYRVPFATHQPERVNLNIDGSVSGFYVDETVDGALVRVESWTSSPQMIAFDPKRKTTVRTELIPHSPVTFENIVATEVKAPSADGTLVPLSIIHRNDLPRDGSNPTYLKGYAAYGNIWSPFFEPLDLAWFERGGIIAVCHARGGGEYGEEWHAAGKLATKPNTIKDFIGCAEYLVKEKYTSPSHLAGQGTSAGGVLIGGAIVRRPDLFGAAVIRVGMVNALRFEQIPIGPFNTSEFGTVTSKEGFEMLWAIDAYHAVEKGKRYPAVMLTTGITDPRVSPWQMAKMAAALRSATSSGKPVFLRVDYGSGHGSGTAKSKFDEELADTYAFLSWQIGRK